MTSSISKTAFSIGLVLMLSFLAITPAFAAVNVQDIATLFDGKTSASVDAGNEFDFEFTADATSGDEIEYVRARTRDQNNQILFTSCTNVGRKTGDDIRIVAEANTPSDTPQGNIDVLVDVYGMSGVSQNDGCNGSSLDSRTFEDRVRIDDNTTSGNSSESSVGSFSSLQALVAALTAQVQALIAAQNKPADKPACPPMGSTASVQSWLISNGYDIPAISKGGAAYGFWGPQTASAHAMAMAACK